MRENIENIDLDETQTNAKHHDFISNSDTHHQIRHNIFC